MDLALSNPAGRPSKKYFEYIGIKFGEKWEKIYN